MKSIFSIICNSLLIVSVSCSSDYLYASDWVNKEYLFVGAVVVACAGIFYVTRNAHDNYHVYAMNKARAAIDKSKSITYENGIENNEDENIRLQLEQYKKMLNDKWIFLYQKGLSLNFTENLSGTMSAANVYCYNLNLSGQGFLNSTIANNTNLDGDFIIENSQLGDMNIDRGSRLVSCNNCLLNDIKSKNGIILELEKSIVDGNIIFDKPGIVVIDKESIINGSLVNGRLVKSSVEK